MSDETVQVTVRIPASVRKQLEEQAKKNDRAMVKEVSSLIKKAAARMEGDLKKKKEKVIPMTFQLTTAARKNLEKMAKKNRRSMAQELFSIIEAEAENAKG